MSEWQGAEKGDRPDTAPSLRFGAPTWHERRGDLPAFEPNWRAVVNSR